MPILARGGHVVLDFFGARERSGGGAHVEEGRGRGGEEEVGGMTKTNPDESDEGPMVGDAEERIYIDRGGRRGSPSERRVAPIHIFPHTHTPERGHPITRFAIQTKLSSITWIT